MDYQALKQKLHAAFPTGIDTIMKAFDFAERAHAGQKRLSGEDYFIHPCAVADILTDFGADVPTIVAALLHDVLEDTKVTEEEINRTFGPEILELVKGVTKLAQIVYISQEDQRAENIRKMFLAMTKDLRIILIKLADRLHNMRSLSFRPPEKQQQIAKETLEIYAALAGRLGISYFKCELEDTAMMYLYPKEYKEITDYLRDTKVERKNAVDNLCAVISEKLKEIGIKGEVNGRVKHIFSIYKKIKNLGVNIDQIYDLIAVRIIVPTIDECYTLLGTVHKMWKPIPDRIKDYITMPKPNNYQSLHTTVVTETGDTFEIQIRTYEMHKVAEYGVAAHYKYKEGTLGVETDLDKKISWIREVIDNQKNMIEPLDFLNFLKIDIFKEDVFVFSPKGDVYNLPIGSTAIDFAYSIHSEVGNKCVGVKINKKIMPLSTILKTGDIVEIITSGASKGPSRDWLKIVKTSSARQKIKQYFKKEMREDNIARGRDMLEREAKRRGYNFADIVTPAWLEYVFSKYSYNSIEDIYAAVGYGEFTILAVLTRAMEFFKKTSEKSDEILSTVAVSRPKRNAGGILIRGFDDFGVKLSHCCNPVPGDAIIGYVSRGRGVSVHKTDCPNVKTMEPERLIEADWDYTELQKYVANVKVVVENKTGILAEVTTCISNKRIPIVAASLRLNHDNDTGIIQLSVEIKNTDELNELLNKLKSLSGVLEVSR
ncbi:MAG: RelA/SpoT family protein [Christensenellales bacterium]|jgi:GTP pyrophosphokinase